MKTVSLVDGRDCKEALGGLHSFLLVNGTQILLRWNASNPGTSLGDGS